MGGYKTWSDGEPIEALDLNRYLAAQVVARFTSEAERDAMILDAEDGQLCHVTGLGVLIADDDDWTPLVTQSAAPLSGVVTLVAGTATVATAAVTAVSRILLTAQTLGTITVPAALAVSARTAATSFTVLSADATDTSVVAWQLVEPA